MRSPEELELETLKTLHGGHIQNLHALSERPFQSLLHAVTLNVAVVAGLVAAALTLSLLGKVLGTALLIMFNILVMAYIQRQGRLYKEEKERYQNVTSSLLNKCPSLTPRASTPGSKYRCIAFLTGTKVFVIVVAIAAVCSITALWFPLVAPQADGGSIRGTSDGEVFTLYRNSVTDESMRIHVATFDASEQEAYNGGNCEQARLLFQNQPGVEAKYWCEKGPFKK